MTDRLDHYQSALLAELREHVAEQPGTAEEPLHPRPRRPRRLVLVAAGVVAAATAGVVVLPGLGAQPAFSVTEGNSGEITVAVDRPEDAEGLEAALAEYGVTADVTYLPWPQECAPGRYTSADRRGIALSVGDELLEVTLAPGVVREGETFVLTVAYRSDGTTGSGVTDFDVATGPVGPCRPVG